MKRSFSFRKTTFSKYTWFFLTDLVRGWFSVAKKYTRGVMVRIIRSLIVVSDFKTFIEYKSIDGIRKLVMFY